MTAEERVGIRLPLLPIMTNHYERMAAQLVDSALPSTRSYWRTKVGYPQFADDPRLLAECVGSTEP